MPMPEISLPPGRGFLPASEGPLPQSSSPICFVPAALHDTAAPSSDASFILSVFMQSLSILRPDPTVTSRQKAFSKRSLTRFFPVTRASSQVAQKRRGRWLFISGSAPQILACVHSRDRQGKLNRESFDYAAYIYKLALE